jgi:hypothetical protein
VPTYICLSITVGVDLAPGVVFIHSLPSVVCHCFLPSRLKQYRIAIESISPVIKKFSSVKTGEAKPFPRFSMDHISSGPSAGQLFSKFVPP